MELLCHCIILAQTDHVMCLPAQSVKLVYFYSKLQFPAMVFVDEEKNKFTLLHVY